MESLVLLSVVHAVDALSRGTALVDVRQDAPHRLRLLFAAGERTRTVLASLLPDLPWVGRAAAAPLSKGGLGPFSGAVRQALRGLRLARVSQPDAERVVRFDFSDGQALVLELRPQRANAALLDSSGRVRSTLRRPRSATERLGVGVAWRPPDPPAGRPDPTSAPAEQVRAALAAGREAGEALERSLMRRLFGIGPAAARLVAQEVGASGEEPAVVLLRRIGTLRGAARSPNASDPETPRGGEVTAVADLLPDALALAERGLLDVERCRLWPWAPADGPPPGLARLATPDAAAVAGAYFEALERAALFRRRADALVALTGREAARLAAAADMARADLEGFADPERHKRYAEALLACGARARREPDAWVVPDPYGPPGATLHVPADGNATMHETADALFRRHRKACRGLERALERATSLGERGERLQALRRDFAAEPDAAGLDALEAALRELGVPVGLAARAVQRRAGLAGSVPRLEGVRLYTSSDGMAILAGRTARGNDRLTFKLSAPDDFWFHARDCPGAHVVVRNEARRRRPPDATLHQAAAVAAWFSEKRGEARVDVQWTLRKYVRRARGGAAGAVLLKRASTVRVVPALPDGQAPGG